MQFLFTIIILAIILGALFVFFEKFFKRKKRLPYKKREFLLNISERKVFEFLATALPSDYVVLPQVKLNSIIKPAIGGKEYRVYQNKINRKTLDFVVFGKQYLTPVLAIEYDGPTHKRPDRIERDNFVNKALEAAGIKILHIKHERNLNLEKVGSEVMEMLKND